VRQYTIATIIIIFLVVMNAGAIPPDKSSRFCRPLSLLSP
jgi:hypothetical protein